MIVSPGGTLTHSPCSRSSFSSSGSRCENAESPRRSLTAWSVGEEWDPDDQHRGLDTPFRLQLEADPVRERAETPGCRPHQPDRATNERPGDQQREHDEERATDEPAVPHLAEKAREDLLPEE